MVDLNVDLPAELAAALSFPDAATGWWRPWLLVAAALALFVFLHRRRRPPVRRPNPPSIPIDRPDHEGPEDPVDAIEYQHLSAETYRLGSHALADLLRRRVDWSLEDGSDEVSTLTERELARAARNRAATRLMSTLGDQRFRRAEPSRRDFRTACTQARRVLGTKR